MLKVLNLCSTIGNFNVTPQQEIEKISNMKLNHYWNTQQYLDVKVLS